MNNIVSPPCMADLKSTPLRAESEAFGSQFSGFQLWGAMMLDYNGRRTTDIDIHRNSFL